MYRLLKNFLADRQYMAGDAISPDALADGEAEQLLERGVIEPLSDPERGVDRSALHGSFHRLDPADPRHLLPSGRWRPSLDALEEAGVRDATARERDAAWDDPAFRAGRIALAAAAILGRQNPDLETDDGRARVDALRTCSGLGDVTAEERDAAYAARSAA